MSRCVGGIEGDRFFGEPERLGQVSAQEPHGGRVIAAPRASRLNPLQLIDDRRKLHVIAEEAYRGLKQGRQRIMAGIAAVIAPDRALLRRDPDGAAQLLLMLVMATVHSGCVFLGGVVLVDDTAIPSVRRCA